MSGYLRSLTGDPAARRPTLRPLVTPVAATPLVPLTLDPQDALAADSEFPGSTPTSQVGRSMSNVTAAMGSSQAAPHVDETHSPDAREARTPLTLHEAVILLTDPGTARHQTRSAIDAPQEPTSTAQRIADSTEGATVTVPALDSRPAASATRPQRNRGAKSHDLRVTPAVVKAATAPTRPVESKHAALSRAEAPPDVHIHIGRIELTAVTPPEPRRRRSEAAKAALPLNEYLRRRDARAR